MGAFQTKEKFKLHRLASVSSRLREGKNTLRLCMVVPPTLCRDSRKQSCPLARVSVKGISTVSGFAGMEIFREK